MTSLDFAASVSALVGDDVICVSRDLPVVELASLLTSQGISAAGVGTPDDLDGIVSERDIVELVAAGTDPSGAKVGDIATSELVWATPETTVAEIATEMLTQWVRHVLIADEGRVVGIVSARDLLSVCAAPLDDDEG